MSLSRLFPMIITVCLSLQVVNGQTQEKIDSVLNIIGNTDVDTIKAKQYLVLADLTLYNDQVRTLEFLQKAENLYQKTDDGKGIARLYAQKANYFYRLGQIDSARHYLVSSVDKSMQIGDSLRAAVIRHNIGILDHYQGNSQSAREIMDTNIPVFIKHQDTLHLANAYQMQGKIAVTDGYYNIAMEHMLKALEVHRSLKDKFRIAEDLIQIGIIYQTTSDHEKAVDILTESYQLYDEIESDQSKAQVLNYMVNSNIELMNYQQAEENLTNALALSEKLDYKANIARVYSNWGVLEFEKENYQQSIGLFKQSYDLWKAIGSPNHEANNLLRIGRSYLAQGDYAQSIAYFDRSIYVADSVKDVEILKNAFFEKSRALEHQAQFQESLLSFKQSTVLSDSIFTIERTNATEELKIIFETEKKEQQIALQESEINVLEQEAQISNLQRILLAVGLLFSLIGFYAIRQKLKRNRLEKEQVDAQLEFKKKELVTHALHLAKKNELLESLKQKAQQLKDAANIQQGYQQLISTIDFDLQDDKNWQNFFTYFKEVHHDFNEKVQRLFPEVTSNDLRYMALLKMNLSSKEIASAVNISADGIKKARQRLRKKMGIAPDQSLEAIIRSI